MFYWNARAAVTGLMMLLAACSPPSPLDLGMSSDVIIQYYADLNTAMCERFVNCCDSQQAEDLLGRNPSLGAAETCEAYFADRHASAMKDALGAAELTYIGIDMVAMEECLNATRSCGSLRVCEQVLTGVRPEGDTCRYDLECIQGNCLLRPEGFGRWCSNGDPGSHCWWSDECMSEGYYCEILTSTTDYYQCVPRKPAGASCELDDECLSLDCRRDSNDAPWYCHDQLPPPPPPGVDACVGK